VPQRKDEIYLKMSQKFLADYKIDLSSDAVWSRFHKNSWDLVNFLGMPPDLQDHPTLNLVNVEPEIPLQNQGEFISVTKTVVVDMKTWERIDLRPRLTPGGILKTLPKPNSWTEVIFEILSENFNFLCRFPMTFVSKETLARGKCDECHATFSCKVENILNDSVILKFELIHPTTVVQHKGRRQIRGEQREKVASDVAKAGSVSLYLMNKRLECKNREDSIGEYIHVYFRIFEIL
jgi:hypothetical protein